MENRLESKPTDRRLTEAVNRLAKRMYEALEFHLPTEGEHASVEEGWRLLSDIERAGYHAAIRHVLSEKADLLFVLGAAGDHVVLRHVDEAE